MKIQVLFLPLIFVLLGCEQPDTPGLRPGPWQGGLLVKDGHELPFGLSVMYRDTALVMRVTNAGEVLEIDEIRIGQDSIYIQMPAFEGYIAGRYNDTLIQGLFVNESREREVPFTARYGQRSRFAVNEPPAIDLSGVWQVVFSQGTPDEYPAKGIFTQQDNLVNGTFRTTTGDYRYLEGVVSGDSLKLSTFDGAHAFLFLASVNDSLMRGTFYSGNHFKEPFVGRRAPDYELPDANTLTYLKEGYETLELEFPDSDGRQVSLADSRFRDKVVIVQVMGSWCPNCLDETKFLVDYLNEHGSDQLQVVALAFEYAKTPEKAFESIDRLRRRAGITYPVLLAQYGSGNKLLANEKLPMLNHVLSYPTTIFIDKSGRVRSIHTGFNGPATGEAYEAFKIEFDSLVQHLLAE